MGSPLSSPLAEIVMNTIDKWITTQFPTDIIIYKRYIDDIFCICTANKVNHILTSLNNYHPKIKFTIEFEKNNKLPFLDINIIRKQGSRWTLDVQDAPDLILQTTSTPCADLSCGLKSSGLCILQPEKNLFKGLRDIKLHHTNF
ncbi:hypothetical protein LAZ67_15001527 [Cordylochernes scorpioides]|uniref:Reverse transcriptase domain-containing protein n=1 Tax=Cordylochernes scorpioides TaxID=51811 RepID=A0ABY6L9L7_9ARAC|nr:hypothetical protein LAZ67_15001527 [Cordylochernes scorpioides]